MPGGGEICGANKQHKNQIEIARRTGGDLWPEPTLPDYNQGSGGVHVEITARVSGTTLFAPSQRLLERVLPTTFDEQCKMNYCGCSLRHDLVVNMGGKSLDPCHINTDHRAYTMIKREYATEWVSNGKPVDEGEVREGWWVVHDQGKPTELCMKAQWTERELERRGLKLAVVNKTLKAIRRMCTMRLWPNSSVCGGQWQRRACQNGMWAI